MRNTVVGAGLAVLMCGQAALAQIMASNLTVRMDSAKSGYAHVGYDVVGSPPADRQMFMSVGVKGPKQEKPVTVAMYSESEELAPGHHEILVDLHHPKLKGGYDKLGISIAFLAYNFGKVSGCEYLAIDLSGGPTATNYPVLYINEVPKEGWGEEYRTEKLLFRVVNPGTFQMGSPTGEVGRAANEDLHPAVLLDPYFIGVFEVTQRQWELVMGNRPSAFAEANDYATRPVERVSYSQIRGDGKGKAWPHAGGVDAESFLGRLRARCAIKTFDLPTEAQWEFACRAGTRTPLGNGKQLGGADVDPSLGEWVRYRYTSGASDGNCAFDATAALGTAKVGASAPNAWGLYDCSGNVWEWCRDWYRVNLGDQAAVNPAGAGNGFARVIRGGGWNSPAAECRSASRSSCAPNARESYLGFRLSCKVE
ncbi:MAG: formylglycine-generating enzyme family protein [Kiritimatiellae bacterium]|nr:formylglycine-generating enzyme family protein [Kiritimatiellia bacterium]